MTEQGDPLARRQQYITFPVSPRRKKLAPDPDVRRTIVDAASKSVREQGVRGLSVAVVLERARLSTRAFYRHFDSKDQLVAAVFLEMTRSEVLRLRAKMSEATDPVAAVVAWIDGDSTLRSRTTPTSTYAACPWNSTRKRCPPRRR